MAYNNEVQVEYPIRNLEIEKIYRSTSSKDGKPYMSSKGNAFTKVDIYIDPRAIEDGEFQGKMSYFDYFGNTDSWEIGTVISGSVVKNGQYFNFNLPPSGKKAVELDVKEIKARLRALEEKVFGKIQGQTDEVDEALDFSKEVIEEKEEDDLPF